MVTYEISKQENGKKLHRFVRTALPLLPLSGVHKMIRLGRIKVNGRKGKPETILTEGDTVTFFMPQEEFDSLKKQQKKFSGVSSQIQVIYEDQHLLLVNKQVGILTHPDQTEHKHTLINQVLAYLHQHGELEQRLFTPSTVNRLDRNTSGIVIVGKDADTIRKLNEDIKQRKLGKWYLTIAHGKMTGSGKIDTPLLREEKSNKTFITKPSRDRRMDAEVKSAQTNYRVLDSNQQFSLVEVELISGRTHQIRAHMKSIGHPLVGDLKYGGHPVGELRHQLLHAYKVRLADGSFFTAPLPIEFKKTLQKTGLRFAKENESH